MVMRPKSSATVVVILSSTPTRSSTVTPMSVSRSSVSSGTISLTAPTRVVLPAPKPPATRIFRARGTAPAWSEPAEPIDHRLQGRVVGRLVLVSRLVHRDEPVGEQVADHHANHTERQVELRGELRDRDRLPRGSQDPPMLRR